MNIYLGYYIARMNVGKINSRIPNEILSKTYEYEYIDKWCLKLKEFSPCTSQIQNKPEKADISIHIK